MKDSPLTRRLLLAIGIALVALWAAKLFLDRSESLPSFDGQRFQEPAAWSAEARTALTEARALRDALTSSYSRWAGGAFWLGMLGLGLTSISTVLAGWRRARDDDRREEFMNKKMTSIGLFCALASVANLAHDRVSTTADEKRADSLQLTALIARIGDELKGGSDEESALLDELRTQVRLARR